LARPASFLLRISAGVIAAAIGFAALGVAESVASPMFPELSSPAGQDELQSTPGDDFLKNEPVRADLRRYGDDGKTPRLIDHYAYFPSREGQAAYRDFVLSRGYKIEREDIDADDRGQLPIFFSKIQAPVAIDKETAFLGARAVNLGGEYDGWETDLVAGRPQ